MGNNPATNVEIYCHLLISLSTVFFLRSDLFSHFFLPLARAISTLIRPFLE